MILRSNLPKLREFAGRSARVLDAGGWYRPFNLATHVIDLNPYESRRVDDALDPEDDDRRAIACHRRLRVGAKPFHVRQRVRPPALRAAPMTSHPSHRPVSALRARMIEDMRVLGFTEKTRSDYVRNVRAFAAFTLISGSLSRASARTRSRLKLVTDWT
jgi:hypothetical protein